MQMDLFDVLVWVLLGALIGWLAGLLMGTKKMSGLLTVIIGVVGAFAGGWLWGELHLPHLFTVSLLNKVLSGLVGAVLLIALLKGFGLLKGSRK